MKTTAKFYHAGCPVCVDAERVITRYLDPTKVDVEVVHLGSAKNRIAEAAASGGVGGVMWHGGPPANVVNGSTGGRGRCSKRGRT